MDNLFSNFLNILFSIFQSFNFSIFQFPIRNSLAHIIVPFILREVALHILSEALGYLRQRDEIFGDGAVVLARPDVVAVAAEGEVREPAIGLKQCDRLNLWVVGHPQQ